MFHPSSSPTAYAIRFPSGDHVGEYRILSVEKIVRRCSPSESTTTSSYRPRDDLTATIRDAAIPGSLLIHRTTSSATACTDIRKSGDDSGGNENAWMFFTALYTTSCSASRRTYPSPSRCTSPVTRNSTPRSFHGPYRIGPTASPSGTSTIWYRSL